jgi:hypothetical protein
MTFVLNLYLLLSRLPENRGLEILKNTTVVCVFKDNMAKTLFFILVRPSLRTIWEKYPKGKFYEKMYNSRLFVNIWMKSKWSSNSFQQTRIQ